MKPGLFRLQILLFFFIAFMTVCIPFDTAASGKTYTLQIKVASDGFYSISGNDLRNAGVAILPVDAAFLGLSRNGKPVAMQMIDILRGNRDLSSPMLFWHGGDRRDLVGSQLQFYGVGVSSDSSNYNNEAYSIYNLTISGEPNPMQSLIADRSVQFSDPVPPAEYFIKTVKLAINSTYLKDQQLDENVDRWVWGGRLHSAGEWIYNSLRLTNFYPPASPGSAPFNCTVRFKLLGTVGDPDFQGEHDTRFFINSNPVASETWDGTGYHIVERNLSPCPLREGGNSIRLYANNTGSKFDSAYIESIELDYRANYVVSPGSSLEFGFDNKALTSVSIAAADIGDSDLEVFDITNAADGQVVRLKKTFFLDSTLKFTEHDKGRKRYIVTTTAGKKTPVEMKIVNKRDLKDKSMQADYIIISPGDVAQGNFNDPLLKLQKHRKIFSGLNVVLVELKDIYANFGFGAKKNGAVKEFIQFAYQNWSAPAPRYVLLAGDGSYDPLGRLSAKDFKGIMPAHFARMSDGHDLPVDSWFADVDTAQSGEDIAIGRLPAKSSAELKIMVDNIIAYEDGGSFGDGASSILLVSDNDSVSKKIEPEPFIYKGSRYKNGVVETFGEIADSIESIFAGSLDIARISLGHSDNEKEDIITAINKGSQITLYVGNGAEDTWKDRNVFHGSDVSGLSNKNRLTFAVSLGTENGRFTAPDELVKSKIPLAEAMLSAKDKGAVGALMGSWRGSPRDYLLFGEEFANAIIDDPDQAIGDIAIKAKQAAMRRSSQGSSALQLKEMVDSMILFGDPALKIKIRLKGAGNDVSAGAAANNAVDSPAASGVDKSSDGGGGGCFIRYMGF